MSELFGKPTFINGFLEDYERYVNYRTDAPASFGKITGLMILGHTLGYNAKHLITPDAVRHNIFCCLVGDSTLTRKTTSQYFGKKIYPRERQLPEETSPEQFVVELSENPEAIQFLPEFTAMLKGISGKGYMSRFVELYNELHGSPSHYRRTLRSRRGEATKFEVKNCYLSVSSTVTPIMLEEKLTLELAEGGFLARFLLVNGKPKPRPRRRLREQALRLEKALRDKVKALLKMKREVCFEYTDEALEQFNVVEREALGGGYSTPFAGRYLNYVVAISDILLVSDAIGYSIEQGKSLYEWARLGDLVSFYLDSISRISSISSVSRVSRVSRDNGENSRVDGESLQTNSTNHTNPTNPTNSTNSLRVPAVYVRSAWSIVEPCLKYATQLCKSVGLARYVRKAQRVIQRKRTISHSQCLRLSNLTGKQFEQAISTLVQRGEVKIEDKVVKREGSGEIMKRIYRWIGE